MLILWGARTEGFNTRTFSVFRLAKHDIIVDPIGSHAGPVDLALIDATGTGDYSKLRAKQIVLFDCDDGTYEAKHGYAYSTVVQKAVGYAKISANAKHENIDGLRRLLFPVIFPLQAKAYAKTQAKFEAQAIFVGRGTFLGSYEPLPKEYRAAYNVRTLAPYDDGSFMYHQRADWLLQLKMAAYPFYGGIVEGPGNLAWTWQQKYFGNIRQFELGPMSYSRMLELMSGHICLCPAGHTRWGSRPYDAMAAGGILITTAFNGDRLLHPPQKTEELEDAEELVPLLERVGNKDVWKQHLCNRRYIEELTPDRMVQDFLDQLEL